MNWFLEFVDFLGMVYEAARDKLKKLGYPRV